MLPELYHRSQETFSRIVLQGVPWEANSSFRCGASEAPDHIRVIRTPARVTGPWKVDRWRAWSRRKALPENMPSGSRGELMFTDS